MKPHAILTLGIATALATSGTARAQATIGPAPLVGGPWHYRTIPCRDAVVRDVTPRLSGDTSFSSGVEVEFRLSRPWMPLETYRVDDPRVVHYQGDANAVMRAEHRGDRVQLCLVSFPLPTIEGARKAFTCNPDTDPRGRVFRVYDYRQRAAYQGMNSEHGCGGA